MISDLDRNNAHIKIDIGIEINTEMLTLRLTLGLKSILKLTRLWLKLDIRMFFVDIAC